MDEVWDADDATEALSEAIRIVVHGITVDGTQLADERDALLWSIVNCFQLQGYVLASPGRWRWDEYA